MLVSNCLGQKKKKKKKSRFFENQVPRGFLSKLGIRAPLSNIPSIGDILL